MKMVLYRVGHDLAEAQIQQQGLLDEINHRVKNTLGTVQSIARLSRGSAKDLPEYFVGFEGRLLALSQAYNLLTENNWVGAGLTAIVRQTLAPFAGPDRIKITGINLMLPAKVALAMSAALQELSTNAAKYGAFSTSTGHLQISWTVDGAGLVRLDWIESGGPIVRPPTRKGFGTQMITGTFRGEPGWSVDLDYRPQGLHCTMHFSLRPRGGLDANISAAAG
jgi:two-component sensor histidine kinase